MLVGVVLIEFVMCHCRLWDTPSLQKTRLLSSGQFPSIGPCLKKLFCGLVFWASARCCWFCMLFAAGGSFYQPATLLMVTSTNGTAISWNPIFINRKPMLKKAIAVFNKISIVIASGCWPVCIGHAIRNFMLWNGVYLIHHDWRVHRTCAAGRISFGNALRQRAFLSMVAGISRSGYQQTLKVSGTSISIFPVDTDGWRPSHRWSHRSPYSCG